MNRYFIINDNDSNLDEIFSNCLETATKCNRSNDGLIVVELNPEIVGTPDCLSGYTELNEAQAQAETEKANWIKPD